MRSEVDFCWAGEKLRLYGGKAVLWERTGTLLITDPHFGKASSFRSMGIPVPTGTMADDLNRLDGLLCESGARHLIILGDFFHHHTGQCSNTMRVLGEWRSRWRSLEVTLIPGNHDAVSAMPPDDWGFRIVRDCHRETPFTFCHDPTSNGESFAIGGHVHPCVTMHDGIGPALRLPCYYFNSHYALLPAFGSFTGTHRVRPEADDAVFAIAPDGYVWPLAAK